MFWDALSDDPNKHLGQMTEYLHALEAQYGLDWRDYADFEDYLIWLNTHHITDDAQRKIIENWVKREYAGMQDSRKHVSQHYDWVRVQGNNIEVWEMNDLVRKRIEDKLNKFIGMKAIGIAMKMKRGKKIQCLI